MTDVTRILAKVEAGDAEAARQLLPLVYEELRKLAAARLNLERPGQTLQATALVHEAYLRLVGGTAEPAWESRGHFFAAAAEAMRRIMIETARRKRAVRHGGGLRREPVDLLADPGNDSRDDLLALDEALSRLEQLDKVKADLVKLRYFAGLTIPEVAEALGISVTTANRYWSYARAWLHEAMSEQSATT